MIVGSDFDGTIPIGKYILKSTRKEIEKFRNCGNIFIIVTGRSVCKFKDAIKKYKIDFFDYAICSGGSVLVDSALNVIKYCTITNKSVFCALEELYKDLQWKKVYINTIANSYLIKNKEQFIDIDEPVVSITVEFKNRKNRRQFSIKNIYEINCYGNRKYIDILPIGVTKATFLLDFKTKVKDCFLCTIGNDENDIQLLEAGDKSFTFIYSKKNVRKKAVIRCLTITKMLTIINNLSEF